MVFTISKERMYHFPHNTLFTEELIFMLKSLDLDRKSYTFKEIVAHLFQSELNEGVFKKFHGNMPYKIISGQVPDKKAIRIKFEVIKKSGKKPNGMPEELFSKVMSSSLDEATDYFIKKRASEFAKKKDGSALKIQYKPTKTWQQNWVEFVRDYIDFAAYCGLLPCYYKLPTERASPEDGYVITPKLKDFIQNKISLEEILMEFKYSNSSINIRRYKQFNIEVRPFYALLKLLSILKNKKINKVERKILFGSISCLTNEKELDSAAEFIDEFIKSKEDFDDYPISFIEEIGRFATGMHRFLTETDLIKEYSEKGITYYSITKKGEDLLNKIPQNSLFFGHYYGELYYSPVVAFILKMFKDYSENGDNEVGLSDVLDVLKNIDKDELSEILEGISRLNPSPIKKIEENKILLNSFTKQYDVSPYVDFASLEEAGFIYLQRISERTTKRLEIKRLIIPPKDTLKALVDAALASDGTKYEDEVEKAIRLLNLGDVRRFGQKTAFQRLSDIVWKLEYESNGEIKTLLIIIETKAGGAISAFKEDKESEDMINTLSNFYKDDFTNLEGIWAVILDSNKIPDSKGHGGFRGDEKLSKSFMEKMMVIHKRLTAAFGKPVLVTAFAIRPFLEYYTYLYSIIKQNNLTNINAFVEEFYMKGKVFFDDYRYIKILNDENHLRKSLFI